jgi:RNA polymerase sigma-70 factor (ECF subfamily)
MPATDRYVATGPAPITVTEDCSGGVATPELVRDFDQIYAAHVDFIWRTVRGLGVAERNVDDAVQEVFVVAYRQLAHFEGRASLRSWLFGIARRVAADHRRWARRKDRGEPLYEDAVHASAPPQLEAVASAEALRTLHAIFDRLEDDKREVFILVEIERMTAPEVAEVLGINVNTVYSRLRSARSAFNAAVAQHRHRQLGGRHG